MFEKILSKLQKTLDTKKEIDLRDHRDLDILEVLYLKPKLIQYKLEGELRNRHKSIPHSTLTDKLKRLSKSGLIDSHLENDGLRYYEITPLALGALLGKGRIDFTKTLSYFQKNKKQYFEMLTALQPQFIEGLRTQPAWFPIQVTEDLWIVYYFLDPEELRKHALLTTLSQRFDRSIQPQVEAEFYCANRMDIEGKPICFAQRKECIYHEGNCPILQKQIRKQAKKLNLIS